MKNDIGSTRTDAGERSWREKKQISAQTTSGGASGRESRSASAPPDLELASTAGVTYLLGAAGGNRRALIADAVSGESDSEVEK